MPCRGAGRPAPRRRRAPPAQACRQPAQRLPKARSTPLPRRPPGPLGRQSSVHSARSPWVPPVRWLLRPREPLCNAPEALEAIPNEGQAKGRAAIGAQYPPEKECKRGNPSSEVIHSSELFPIAVKAVFAFSAMGSSALKALGQWREEHDDRAQILRSVAGGTSHLRPAAGGPSSRAAL